MCLRPLGVSVSSSQKLISQIKVPETRRVVGFRHSREQVTFHKADLPHTPPLKLRATHPVPPTAIRDHPVLICSGSLGDASNVLPKSVDDVT
jgi:hypothetical protein